MTFKGGFCLETMTANMRITVFSKIGLTLWKLLVIATILTLILGLSAVLGFFFLSGNHADIVQDCRKAIETEFLSVPVDERLGACIENTYYSLEFAKASLLIFGGLLSVPSGLALLILRFFKKKTK